MTDAVLIALIAGVVTTAGSIITAVVSVRNGKKADALAVKADEIHEVTNSAKQLVDDKLAAANTEIAILKTMMGKLIEAKTEKAP